MAYDKQTWVSGEVITSTKLNHMEDGIANSDFLIIHSENNTLDKTWREIFDALASEKLCVVSVTEEDYAAFGIIVSAYKEIIEDDRYFIIALNESYVASNENDYPVLD